MPRSDSDFLPSIAARGDALGGDIVRHLDLAFRACMSHGPEVVRTARFLRLLTGEMHPFGNMAVVSDPTDLVSAGEALEPLRASGAPAAVFFAGEVSEAVDASVRGMDFEPHSPMPAMAVDIERLGRPALPAGYEFTRLALAQADRDDWTEAFAVGYELPTAVARAFAPQGDDDSPDAEGQYFAIRKRGAIVATSALYLKEGLAGIYCVSTIPEERRKGLGAYATSEPLRRAYDLGYRVGVLQSSAQGHSVYLQLGFLDLGEVPLYVRNARLSQ